MRLKAVGIAAGIVLSTAAAAENVDWFGERLFDAFANDLRSPAYEAPAPNASPQQRRNPPAPFDSPPFPSADWQIGGTPIIGDANNIAPWPLMEAICSGPNGEAWKKSRIQIYGWECFSWNVSTSTNTSRAPNANFPLIYDLRPNRFEQNQFVLYVERVPNEFYMYMNGATTHPTTDVPFQSGSFPVKPGYAPEWGILNYTMVRIAPSAFLTFRNEFYNDVVGSRTGQATKYSEHSLGVTWWPDKIITLRPELRFDHSYDTAAFDNGRRRNQLVGSMDVIIHY